MALIGSAGYQAAMRMEAERAEAISGMHRMPPEEFRAFMLRNGWMERWPDLWGPDAEVLVITGLTPPPAPVGWVRERTEALHDSLVAMGFHTRSKADSALEKLFANMEETLAGYIEDHARRWTGHAGHK